MVMNGQYWISANFNLYGDSMSITSTTVREVATNVITKFINEILK